MFLFLFGFSSDFTGHTSNEWSKDGVVVVVVGWLQKWRTNLKKFLIIVPGLSLTLATDVADGDGDSDAGDAAGRFRATPAALRVRKKKYTSNSRHNNSFQVLCCFVDRFIFSKRKLGEESVGDSFFSVFFFLLVVALDAVDQSLAR